MKKIIMKFHEPLYFFIIFYYLLNCINELSLNLSKIRKMESKIRIESTFITNIQ
jgi:hypothetical protein